MSAAATLPRLRSLRNRYDADALREQRVLLREVKTLRLRRWRELEALHEDLLFLCAFPGSPAIAREARMLLRSIPQRMHGLPKRERAQADDTGTAGSVTRHVFPFPVARWLAKTENAEIDWRYVEDESALDAVMRASLAPAAREAFDSGDYTTREFAAWARPATASSDLQWLTTEPRAEDDWDEAEATVVWTLGDSARSVTRNMIAGVTNVPRTALRRPSPAVVSQIATPLSSIELLPRRRAAKVVDCARAALAARCREVN